VAVVSDDDTDAAWHEQELCERQRREEEALLRADPAYEQWLKLQETKHENSSEKPD
jgi:hypothetical protein